VTTSVNAAASQVWGPGGISLQGDAVLKYPAGAGAAAATFKQTGAWSINGGTSCFKIVPAGTITASQTLTTANLDTNLGAASGCFATGLGASVCNYGP
jgi:hypothetical protein